MPRLNRNTVEFTVGGKTMTATFQHIHDERGVIDATSANGLKVKHVTLCRLNDGKMILRGESKCSMKDTYQWRFGVRQAFIRALAAGGVTPQSGNRKLYGECMEAFFTELRKKSYAPHTPPSPASMAMTLPIRDGQVIHPEPVLQMHGGILLKFIPTPRLTGHTPIYNQHGLGYCGVD